MKVNLPYQNKYSPPAKTSKSTKRVRANQCSKAKSEAKKCHLNPNLTAKPKVKKIRGKTSKKILKRKMKFLLSAEICKKKWLEEHNPNLYKLTNLQKLVLSQNKQDSYNPAFSPSKKEIVEVIARKVLGEGLKDRLKNTFLSPKFMIYFQRRKMKQNHKSFIKDRKLLNH